MSSMSRIFHCGGEWNFHYERTTTKVKVIKGKEKDYVFEIGWNSKKMLIQLQTYDKKEAKIQGTFKVVDGDLSGKIEFVVKKKRLLEGTPDCFVSSPIWTLYKGNIKH